MRAMILGHDSHGVLHDFLDRGTIGVAAGSFNTGSDESYPLLIFFLLTLA